MIKQILAMLIIGIGVLLTAIATRDAYVTVNGESITQAASSALQSQGRGYNCIAPDGEKRFTESECASPTATSEVRP